MGAISQRSGPQNRPLGLCADGSPRRNRVLNKGKASHLRVLCPFRPVTRARSEKDPEAEVLLSGETCHERMHACRACAIFPGEPLALRLLQARPHSAASPSSTLCGGARLPDAWGGEKYQFPAHTPTCVSLQALGLSLLAEEAPEGVVVVLVECCVNQRVEERIGVAKPQEDALPDGGQAAGTEGADELRQEEGDPAQHKHANEDAHHHGRPLLLLLPPRVPAHLKGHHRATRREHHLSLLRGLLHLGTKETGG